MSPSPFSSEDSISNDAADDDDAENDDDRSTTISAVVVVEIEETLLLLAVAAGRTITSSDNNCIDSMAAPTNAVPSTRMYIRLVVIARLLMMVLPPPPPLPLPPLVGKIGFMLPVLLERLFLGLMAVIVDNTYGTQTFTSLAHSPLLINYYFWCWWCIEYELVHFFLLLVDTPIQCSIVLLFRRYISFITNSAAETQSHGGNGQTWTYRQTHGTRRRIHHIDRQTHYLNPP